MKKMLLFSLLLLCVGVYAQDSRSSVVTVNPLPNRFDFWNSTISFIIQVPGYQTGDVISAKEIQPDWFTLLGGKLLSISDSGQAELLLNLDDAKKQVGSNSLFVTLCYSRNGTETDKTFRIPIILYKPVFRLDLCSTTGIHFSQMYTTGMSFTMTNPDFNTSEYQLYLKPPSEQSKQSPVTVPVTPTFANGCFTFVFTDTDEDPSFDMRKVDRIDYFVKKGDSIVDEGSVIVNQEPVIYGISNDSTAYSLMIEKELYPKVAKDNSKPWLIYIHGEGLLRNKLKYRLISESDPTNVCNLKLTDGGLSRTSKKATLIIDPTELKRDAISHMSVFRLEWAKFEKDSLYQASECSVQFLRTPREISAYDLIEYEDCVVVNERYIETTKHIKAGSKVVTTYSGKDTSINDITERNGAYVIENSNNKVVIKSKVEPEQGEQSISLFVTQNDDKEQKYMFSLTLPPKDGVVDIWPLIKARIQSQNIKPWDRLTVDVTSNTKKDDVPQTMTIIRDKDSFWDLWVISMNLNQIFVKKLQEKDNITWSPTVGVEWEWQPWRNKYKDLYPFSHSINVALNFDTAKDNNTLHEFMLYANAIKVTLWPKKEILTLSSGVGWLFDWDVNKGYAIGCITIGFDLDAIAKVAKK